MHILFVFNCACDINVSSFKVKIIKQKFKMSSNQNREIIRYLDTELRIINSIRNHRTYRTNNARLRPTPPPTPFWRVDRMVETIYPSRPINVQRDNGIEEVVLNHALKILFFMIITSFLLATNSRNPAHASISANGEETTLTEAEIRERRQLISAIMSDSDSD